MARQGKEVSTIVISTKQDHQIGLAHSLGGTFPDLGINVTATAIINVGTEQPKRARPIDGEWLNVISTLEVILQLLPELFFATRIGETSQRR